MGVLFRVVVTFSIIASFSIIFFSSFFTQSRYFSLPSFEHKTSTGVLMFEGATGSTIYKKQSDIFHTLYSDTENIKLVSHSQGKNLDTSESGKYLTSFRDIGAQYTISGPGYKIEQEGVGEIFIDTTTSPGKVFVMPLTTSVQVSLLSGDEKEKYTDIFLTPHMYLEFHPARGKFLKNADSIRVETVYRLGYFGGKMLNMGEDEYLQKYSSQENIFLSSVLTDIYSDSVLRQNILTDIGENEVGKIPGYDAIRRYIHLFVNKEKQKIFYKNLILENTLALLQEENYDSSLLSRIREDLDTLKAIDITSYDEVFGVIRSLQSLIFSSYREQDIASQMYLGSLGTHRDILSSEYFQLYSFVLFSGYDSQAKFSRDIFTQYVNSFSTSVNTLQTDERTKMLRYQYFSHFLEKQIHFLLDSAGVEDFAFVNSILGKYIDTSSVSYNAGPTEKVTALYVYNELLKKLDRFIRNEAFFEERNEVSVLVLDPKNKISAQQVKILKNHVASLYETYEKNKKFLDTSDLRDKSIIEEMETSRRHLDEYFRALENYEKYESEFNTAKQTLSAVDIYGYREDIIVSHDEAINYFSQFVGFPISGLGLEIIDEVYYRVTDVYLAGKRFSFDLHPYEEYKMENIVVDGESLDFEYKLGRIKDVWEEKYKTAGIDQKHLYDFSRFFLITFFAQDDPSIEIYSVGDTRLNEDKTEIIFKRDTLLGDKGEFSSLKDVFMVEYDDIRLEKNSESYDIFLTDTQASFKLSSDLSGEKTHLEMDAQYILTQEDHYFTDIQIKIIQDLMVQRKVYEFDGNKIFIVGKMHIGDFTQTLTHILENIGFYNTVYTSIQSIHGNVDISMHYTLRNNKMSFKFDSNGKNYTILVDKDMVDVIYRGTEKRIQDPIPVQDISSYIE